MSITEKCKTRCLLLHQTINANVVHILSSSVFHCASCAFILEFISCLFSFVSSSLSIWFLRLRLLPLLPSFLPPAPCLPHIFQSSKVLRRRHFYEPFALFMQVSKKNKHLNLDECSSTFSNCTQKPSCCEVKILKTLYIVYLKYHQLPIEREGAETANYFKNQQCMYFTIWYIIFHSPRDNQGYLVGFTSELYWNRGAFVQ